MTDSTTSMWRAPIMWVVLGLPLAAIAASVALLVSALHSGGSDAIADRVQETGQAQVANLDPDLRAQRLGLSAVVTVRNGVLQVLPVSGNFDRSAPLRLSFRHPIQAGLDQGHTLRPDELGWRIEAASDLSHDWSVQLASANGDWRIQGRLGKGQHAVLLKPAFGPQ